MWKRPIPFEQAVYGSFPFWSRGYAVLARSANCQPEWLSSLKLACQRFGERPRDCADARGMFAMPLSDGACMIVGVFPNGRDDQGRPGALVFHAQFISPRAYRKASYNPFAFIAGLRGEWSIDDVDSTLPTGSLIDAAAELPEPFEGDRAYEIARALMNRKRIVIPSTRPIDLLARSAWSLLPTRIRSRISVATFAYDNGNQFDLVALPGQRAAGLALMRDPSCLIIEADEPSSETQTVPDSSMTRSNRPHILGRILRSILPSIVLVAMLGCSGGEAVTPEAIAQARKTWENAGIKNYELELKIVAPAGHYRSTVRDGKVQKVESIQPDGRFLEVHPGDPRFYSIDGQFLNMIEELALMQTAEPFGQPKGTKIIMRFGPDAKLGYPHWYRRDVFGVNRSAAIDIVRLDVQK